MAKDTKHRVPKVSPTTSVLNTASVLNTPSTIETPSSIETLPNLSPETLPHLPLIDIFSKSPSDVKNLLEQINAILRQRLKNEFMIAEALDEGLSSEKLNFYDAVKMHNGAKDSIGDLVKIKQLLEGNPTAHLRLSEDEIDDRLNRLMKLRIGKG